MNLEKLQLKTLAAKRIIVTHADTDLGAAVCIALARAGADVALVYSRSGEREVRETVKVISSLGSRSVCIPGESTTESFCSHVPQEVLQKLGGIDALINIASSFHVILDIESVETTDLDTLLSQDFFPLFWMTKATVPYLKSGSTIINVMIEDADFHEQNTFTAAGAVFGFSAGLASVLKAKNLSTQTLSVSRMNESFQTDSPFAKRFLEVCISSLSDSI